VYGAPPLAAGERTAVRRKVMHEYGAKGHRLARITLVLLDNGAGFAPRTITYALALILADE